MEQNELDKAVCKALSLQDLGAGWHRFRDDNGNFVGEWDNGFTVHSLWIATVIFHYYSDVTIGIAKYSTERKAIWEKKEIPILYKGIVLVDNLKGSFIGADPLRSVELIDFNDLVAERLGQINLMPHVGGVIPDGETQDFDFKVFMPHFSAHLKFRGVNIDPIIKQLWASIHQTRKLIAKAYNDNDMNDFFNRGIRHTLA